MVKLLNEPWVTFNDNLESFKTISKEIHINNELKLHKILEIKPIPAAKMPIKPLPVIHEQLHAETDLKLINIATKTTNKGPLPKFQQQQLKQIIVQYVVQISLFIITVIKVDNQSIMEPHLRYFLYYYFT